MTTSADLIEQALKAGQQAVDSAVPKPQSMLSPEVQAAPVNPLAGAAQMPTGQTAGGLQTPTQGAVSGDIKSKITKFESQNNYTAKSKSSSASGVAQWLDSTWKNYGGYKRAADAPSAIQDKRLADDMARLTKKYNGDEKLIALAWIGGEGAANRLLKGDTTVLTKKDANGLTYQGYIDKVLGQNATSTGPVSHDQVGYDGHQIQAWIQPALDFARQNGWQGKVISGIRTTQEQSQLYDKFTHGGNLAAAPGKSNHEAQNGGAVDVTNPEQLDAILTKFPGQRPKWGWTVMGKDKPHFSLTGR